MGDGKTDNVKAGDRDERVGMMEMEQRRKKKRRKRGGREERRERE